MSVTGLALWLDCSDRRAGTALARAGTGTLARASKALRHERVPAVPACITRGLRVECSITGSAAALARRWLVLEKYFATSTLLWPGFPSPSIPSGLAAPIGISSSAPRQH